jgi:N-acyl homoserine lactone hydrolase
MTELRMLFSAAVLAAAIGCSGQRSEGVRLYVLDGGTLHVSDPARFQLKKEDVAETNFAVACYLVTHPKGTLLWDACAVPDSEWTATGSPVKHHLVLPDSQERDITLVRPLAAQVADAGYSPANITYLALSHYD